MAIASIPIPRIIILFSGSAYSFIGLHLANYNSFYTVFVGASLRPIIAPDNSLHILHTFFTEFSLVAANALALAANAVSVPVAVGHLALVMPQRAFLALPAWIALALAVYVFSALRAQHRTHTWEIPQISALINGSHWP